jgi:hypothetical protein
LKTIFLYISLWATTVAPLYAQTPQQVQQDLQAHLQHIQYWRFEYSAEDTVFKETVSQDDSIVQANKQLLAYITAKGASRQMLQADIKLPENSDLKITTSPDGKLRVYSWDAQTGNTTHHYYAIAQYETKTGVATTVLNDVPQPIVESTPASGSYYDVQTITANNGKKYYLLFSSSLGNQVTKTVSAYSIDNTLSTADLFRVADKSLNTIEYTYDQAANYDFKKMKERYTIHISKQKLYVPVMDGANISGQWLIYVWNGEQFVFDKNAK